MIKEVFEFDSGTIEELLKFTGYIVGTSAAIQQNQRASQIRQFAGIDFEKIFSPRRAIFAVETLADMLHSGLMRETEYDFIKGPLQNVVKHWIDKFYYIQLHLEIGRDGQADFDRLFDEIVMNILSDNYTLSDFWRNDLPNNTSFFKMINERFIHGYPEEISKMCKMCYQLIGQKDYNYCNRLVNLLSKLDYFT